MTDRTDVLIVGAGPTGLMLALWLVRAGVAVRIVDRKAGPTRETRAVGVQARTLETYGFMGLADAALAEGIPSRAISMWSQGARVARAEFARMGEGVSPYPTMFIMGQDRTEALLLAALEAAGGRVDWNCALEDFRHDPDGVTAVLRHADGSADGRGESVRAAWAAGCDGAGSPVRHALGVGFPGGTYAQRFYVADVRATGTLSEGELALCVDDGGATVFFPMKGHDRYRIVGMVPPALAELEHPDPQAVFAEGSKRTGMTVHEVAWFSTYRVHHRVARSFRQGRVFLLGDAGHVHTPVGGQGMNTGLMDAANLGWKLGLVLTGGAGERLLDSYAPERVPFARRLVKTTDRVFSLVSSRTPFAAFLRGQVAPRAFWTVAHLRAAQRLLFATVSQTGVRYPDGALSRGKAGGVAGGDRLPWVPGPDGTSNFDAMRPPRVHLQVYGTPPPALVDWAARHPEWPLVTLPDSPAARAKGLRAGAVYLVRPDGYVAWASPGFDAAAFDAYRASAWGIAPG